MYRKFYSRYFQRHVIGHFRPLNTTNHVSCSYIIRVYVSLTYHTGENQKREYPTRAFINEKTLEISNSFP